MPSIDIENKEDISGTVSQPIIGIIYPPPEVRSILFKNVTERHGNHILQIFYSIKISITEIILQLKRTIIK